jgi:hypothetical membrane protein
MPHRLLAFAGIAGPLAFVTAALVAAARWPEYEHAHRFVSELAEPRSPVRHIMVWGAFVPGGLAIAAFSWPLARAMGDERRPWWSARLVRAFGFGLVLAGLFPCDDGGPLVPRTLAGAVHNAVAIAVLPAIAAAPALAGSLLARMGGLAAAMARRSLAVSRIAMTCLLLMLIAVLNGGRHRGVPQRVHHALAFGWLGGLALVVLRCPLPGRCLSPARTPPPPSRSHG